MLILVALVAGGIFVNALGAEFLWDDHYIIVDNEQIRDLGQAARSFGLGYWRRIREIGGPMAYRDYRPVPEMSFAADYAIWGARPVGFHISSILVHAANSVLVYFFAHRIFGTRRGAAFCALLFAAHPLHVEAVVWTKARSVMLAVLFTLACLLLYLRHLEEPPGRRASALYAGSLVAFALALGCKATVALVPILLAVYLWCFPGRATRRGLFALLPLVGMAAALFALTASLPESPEPDLVVPPYPRLLSMVGTVGVYLRLLAVPVGLCVHHRFPVIESVDHPALLSALPWELLLLAGMVLAYRRSKIAFFGLAWILIGMAPLSNLIVLSRPIGELRGYGPSLGLCLVLALLLHNIPALARAQSARRGLLRLSMALCGLLVALYSGLVIARNVAWGDELRLMHDTVAKNPRSIMGYTTMAKVYEARGRDDLALKYFRHTLTIAPNHLDSVDRLFTLCRKLGLNDEAIAHYEQLVQLRPPAARHYIGLGIVYAQKGWRGRAMAEFEKALRLDPASHDAHYNLGLGYIWQGDYDMAAAELRQAIALGADKASAHHHLGVAYHRMGRNDLALRQYQESLRRGATADTWLAMGACYQELGSNPEAMRCYEKCLELGGTLTEEAERRLAELGATEPRGR
ncbi:MAG: tetratricopeptide repeat protein [Armatimonadota bacterium]